MAKKVVRKTKLKNSRIKVKSIENPIEKQIEDFGKGVAEGIGGVERWMVERRKFLIKLAWVIGFISVLLIFSRFYMQVKGFG